MDKLTFKSHSILFLIKLLATLANVRIKFRNFLIFKEFIYRILSSIVRTFFIENDAEISILYFEGSSIHQPYS